MPKAYWVAHGDITDLETYERYRAANGAAFAKYGARFLVRGGTQTVVEGAARARCVVLEFPSLEAATACYHSPEYAQAMAIRLPAAKVDLIIVEGYEG